MFYLFKFATARSCREPHTDSSTDALRGVIESFVLREGTDYGDQHFSLEQKVSHVLRQLERNEAKIMFHPNSETIDIVVGRKAKPSGQCDT